MNVITTHRSPNFTDTIIPVEFAVLHFTAGPLERTLELFLDESTEVSSHCVIDRDGSIYELVDCMNGSAKRAWHAGKSRYEIARGSDRFSVEAFNDRSIGIELVNLNGNIFPYTAEQYTSLTQLLRELGGLYPALTEPEAIVGHEQIAGFRGKSDPGRCFDWGRVFAECFPGKAAPVRPCVCPDGMALRLQKLAEGVGVTFDPQTGLVSTPKFLPANFFGLLSSLSEAALDRGE